MAGLADFLETLGSGSAHNAAQIEKNRTVVTRQKLERAQGFRTGPLTHQQALNLHQTFLDLGRQLIAKQISPKDYELSLHQAMLDAINATKITDLSNAMGFSK